MSRSSTPRRSYRLRFDTFTSSRDLIQTAPPVHGGLTDFGADVVRRCNRLGVVVDVAHGTRDLVKRAADVATRPLVISHTSLAARPSTGGEMKPSMSVPVLGRYQQLPRYANALLAAGFTREKAGMVLGGNYRRVFAQALG